MLIFNKFKNKIAVDDIMQELILFGEIYAVTKNVYKEYIINHIVKDLNALSLICERGDDPGWSLLNAAKIDIEDIFKNYFEKDVLYDYAASNLERNIKSVNFPEYNIKIQKLCEIDSPEKFLDGIIDFYKRFGGGKNNGYIAFKFNGEKNKFIGIDLSDIDRYDINDLYCIDYQKKMICENTELFLRGDNTEKKANNVLLAGDSGTGKSTLVKSVLEKYYANGLRLIELDKKDIIYFEKIADEVKNKNLKYIIFIDDLSFETDETEYKTIKSIIDGKITKQPNNILIYATSNRKHLIRETWRDREEDEINVNDTKNELLSLSERFGIKLTFTSISKEEYLLIVENMLKQKNINDFNKIEELKEKSLVFALKYNGFSGRTARQFINSL